MSKLDARQVCALRRAGNIALFGAALTVLAPRAALADQADDKAAAALHDVQTADREIPSVQAAVNSAQTQLLTVEQRLANGDLLYQSKDYLHAGLVYSEIIEGFPNTPSYPDATWMRGETYYASGEFLSARRDYRELVNHASEPRYAPYLSKALGRLVDVSIRLGDYASLDEVFQKLGQIPPSQVDAPLAYAKGKAYYFRKDYANAEAAFRDCEQRSQTQVNGTRGNDLYRPQARYFLGLVAMKRAQPMPVAASATKLDPNAPPPAAQVGDVTIDTSIGPRNDYKPAIEAFRQVTVLPGDTDEHKHVIDLAWMAIGRLYYEMEQYQQASEAYAKVNRDSPEFDTMLYELAWVYVRLGDVQRAERALEVLSIADPSSEYAGDGTLLRADLLLRAGAFDKALQLYIQTRDQFDPMRVKVDNFLASTKDPAAYYDKLSQQDMDTLDMSDSLPPIAIQWAREAEDGPLAFAVIADVNQCKKLIARSEKLITKLVSVTASANRVRAFPELLAGEQRALGLINQVAHARFQIAQGFDSEESSSVTGEMEQVRSQRRALMGTIAGTPITSADFAERDYQGSKQWNNVSQELSRRQLEIDQLHAVVNGLRRMLKEDAQRGVARDPASVQRFNDEIDANEHDLKLAQDESTSLREQIEIGRAQVGLGDSRYQNDALARAQFRDLLDREAQLASEGQAGGSAQNYARSVQGTLAQARSTEDRLIAIFTQLDAQVNQKVGDLRGKIDAEASKITSYKGTLAQYDGEARDLVGHVAQRNFTLVRDRLQGIVLRADVGITEQAWEVREEELDRVRNLQSERAREEQILDEELREVLDDAGGDTSGAAK
ncbi:MAG: tetratricopeptide repeat protein [Polyangiaceae bacterium]